MNAVQETIADQADEETEVALHFKTQEVFKRLMAKAREQFGFSEAAISQRMMLMSLPTDEILVFKDRLSRTSLLFNTANERVEIPHGLSNRWDEIWGEFLTPIAITSSVEPGDAHEESFRKHRLYPEGVALARQFLDATEGYEKSLALVRLKRLARLIEEEMRGTPVCGFALMVKDANCHLST